jgi:hypothetical protein
MVRWSVVFVSLLVVFGMGCGGEQSSDAGSGAQSGSSRSADTVSTDTTKMDATKMDSTNDPSDAEASAPSTTDAARASDGGETASGRTLSTAQKNRIGGRLQRLIRGEEGGARPVKPVGSRRGESVYEVTIKTDNPDALREAGIPLGTVQGSIATARLTIDQILTAAAVDGVGGIQAAVQQETHQEDRSGDMEVQPMGGNDSSG